VEYGDTGTTVTRALFSQWRIAQSAYVGVSRACHHIPFDVFSMISLMVPLVILNEISIWLVRGIEKKRDKERAEAEAEE
jgi:sec-independent protein translocase protein TatC